MGRPQGTEKAVVKEELKVLRESCGAQMIKYHDPIPEWDTIIVSESPTDVGIRIIQTIFGVQRGDIAERHGRL